jgi:acetolactate synthase-1/2/3 large subunit
MATSGPGATNLVTGIANAYMDSSPMVALTGQVPSAGVNTSYMIGKDAFQEADIIGIATAVTKYSYQPRSVPEIPLMVNNAFYIASTGRPGPVLIDLPKNVQSGITDVEFTNKIELRGYKLITQPNPAKISEASALLTKAERPLILVGGGAVTSGASDEIVALRFTDGTRRNHLYGQRRFPRIPPFIVGQHRHAWQPRSESADGRSRRALSGGHPVQRPRNRQP